MNSSNAILPDNSSNTKLHNSPCADALLPTDWPELVTARQLGEFLGVSWLTLHRWRKASKGPRYLHAGDHSIRYRRADVEAWLAEISSW